MHSQTDVKRFAVAIVLGLPAVVTLGATRREPAAVPSAIAVNDSACFDLLNQLELTPGTFTIVDNGIVRDTIPNPSPALQQSPGYRRARRCVDSTDLARRSHYRALQPDYSRLMMTHTMIPEYHDEQRLSDGAGGLGPKVNLYASPNLGGFKQLWQFTEHGARGILVGHIFVDPLAGETIPATYAALGLARRGLYCLWLARPAGAPSYRAFVRRTNNQGVCADTMPATSLSVQISDQGDVDSLYPPVARFSESAEGKPLLGVRCLNAWCEIGEPPYTLRNPLPVTMGAATSDYRARIKGWHDEQILSTRNPANRRTFIPTSAPALRAALVPRPGVEWLSTADFSTGWKDVGDLYLEQDPPAGSKYARWGLKMGKNAVALRFHNSAWSVRLISASDGMHFWRLTQRDFHPDAAIPGTARFRWTIGDDGLWLPCGMSCCHMEG